MSEEKTGLKNCPFCESDNLEFYTTMEDGWYVYCNECCCQGGEGVTKNQAKVLWNMRAKQ